LSKKIIHTKLFNRLIWVACILCIAVLLVAAVRASGKQMCKNVSVKFNDNNQRQFINEKMILQLIGSKDFINKKTKDEIDIAQIEKKLTSNVWIKKADVFFSNSNTLSIQITQRTPLYRLFTLTNQSFYLDDENRVLPLNNEFNTRLPVFTGYKFNISNTNKDSNSLAGILAMASYINNDAFWNAQIQQIECTNNGLFEIVPTVGDHIILFGDTVKMNEKFTKLKKYYNTVATKIGFDKYKYLNVQFNNQIIGSNNYVNIMDSINARIAIQQFLNNNKDTVLFQRDTIRNNRITDTISAANNVPNNRQATGVTNRNANSNRSNSNNNRRNSSTPQTQSTPRATVPARTRTTPNSNNRPRNNQTLNNNRN
jgi:cell division protein FtsQ